MRIWIDLENTPHALFFPPLIRKLEEDGDEVVLTARDCGQTLGLLDLTGLPYRRVGAQAAGPAPIKAASVVVRAVRLATMMRSKHIDLAVSHSSRSHVLAARMLGIPVVTLLDYEYAATGIFTRFSNRILIPEMLPRDRIEAGTTPLLPYPGFKEQLYALPREPDGEVLRRLGLPARTIVILVRPPATRAHYHDQTSDRVFRDFLSHLESRELDLRVLLLPRYPEQARELKGLRSPPFQVLEEALPGHALLSIADLVVSGGGTMVREAVSMGIPAISIFQSRMGGVDESLIREGKLMHITHADQFRELSLAKRDSANGLRNEELLNVLVERIREGAGLPTEQRP